MVRIILACMAGMGVFIAGCGGGADTKAKEKPKGELRKNDPDKT